ncbi:MAG: S8 family peptidase [Acidobacteriota bacterium]
MEDGLNARSAARSALRAASGTRHWRLTTLARSSAEFLGRQPRHQRPLTPAAAWDCAYRLRELPYVKYAEPLFALTELDQHPSKGMRRPRSASAAIDRRTDGRYQWPLEVMRVPAAWRLASASPPGAGIRIAQPDTGYTRHPLIAGPSLRPDLGHDFQDDDKDPLDELSTGVTRHPGHGTGTASVIIGARRHGGAPGAPFVEGTAPAAALVPIRTTRSVVLWSTERLVRAIRFAIARRAHVISISLGGVIPSRALHLAVSAATAAGVLVLCAAGNHVGFVVYPAAFPEVIAVAASDIADAPWTGSSRGPTVDIAAPGHSVYRARTRPTPDGPRYDVERSSGTSYAVAATAGVAALWLAHHGRSALVRRYGAATLPKAFKALLQATARTPAGWDPRAHGAGIVDAGRLLEAALPTLSAARSTSGARQTPGAAMDSLTLLAHALTPASRSEVRRAVATVLGVSTRGLAATLGNVGDEIVFLTVSDAVLRARLTALALGRAGRTATSRRSVTAVRRGLAAASSVRLRSILRTNGWEATRG